MNEQTLFAEALERPDPEDRAAFLDQACQGDRILRVRIERLLARAEVVVCPSVWNEPFGLVGLEAMAHAKPVVAFSVGGIPEWLADGETGFLAPRKDTLAMGNITGAMVFQSAIPTVVALVLAGSAWHIDGDTLIAYYAGTQPGADRTVSASNFMYMALQEWAVERGFRRFDFCRSRVGSGAFDFKRHQGFEPTQLHYCYHLARSRHPQRLADRCERLLALWRSEAVARTAPRKGGPVGLETSNAPRGSPTYPTTPFPHSR